MHTSFTRYHEPQGLCSRLQLQVELADAIEPLRALQSVIVLDSYSRDRPFDVLRMPLHRYLDSGPITIGGLRYLCPEMLITVRVQ